MKETIGDLWSFYNAGSWICITTNGFIKKNGCCTMGRGCALEAAQKFPLLPKELGERISFNGNIPFIFTEYRLITYPVKYLWFNKADLKLILKSAHMVRNMVDCLALKEIIIPRPGCKNGQLKWADVKKNIEPIFNDSRFVLITNEQ